MNSTLQLADLAPLSGSPVVNTSYSNIGNFIVLLILTLSFIGLCMYSVNKYLNDLRESIKEEKRIMEEAYKEIYE